MRRIAAVLADGAALSGDVALRGGRVEPARRALEFQEIRTGRAS